MIDFVHLRTHSEYSLSEGLLSPLELPSQVMAAGMSAVGLTDIGNCFAFPKFYRAALQAGVKPVIGVDIGIVRDSGNLVAGVEQRLPIVTLLAADGDEGRQKLFELVSQAWRDNIVPGTAALHREWLNPKVCKGLIAISGGVNGDIGQALQNGKADNAAALLKDWQRLFPDAFYIELQRTGRSGEQHYIAEALQLAVAEDCPVVATNEVCFLHSNDFEAHEARVCIGAKEKLNDDDRPRRHSPEQYLRSAGEMQQLFADIPEAIENSVAIAQRCSVLLPQGEIYLPRYPEQPSGQDEFSYLQQRAEEGLESRLATYADTEYAADVYSRRLNQELKVVRETGYAGYFLIVMDFVEWAKEQKIPVGPGRGSGVGSLVAWALKITDLDPLRYGLIFERFLNPERVGMPDFDIDFCQERRDEVIQYVTRRYGSESVAGIITFNRMAARAVIHDTTRVLNKSFYVGERLAALIPGRPGTTLAKARDSKENPHNAEALEEEIKSEDARQIWQLGEKLEGLARNPGRHAGGIVIAPKKLTTYTPLYRDQGSGNAADQDNVLLTQFDKNDIEKCGLVKFDFLGLRTLTVIDRTLDNIEGRPGAKPREELTTDAVPLDDSKVYEQLTRGHTTAVFQLESAGMRALLRAVKPVCFQDIIALVALFRPGPLQQGMDKDYADRKNNSSDFEHYHPSLEPILRETYGVFIYQEQVMECARVLADYSAGRADLLRRAMGKKDPAEMESQRKVFIDNASKKGVDVELAEEIFDVMESFAGYGFNKSHAAAYALLAYHTAWLKCHYPAEYLIAEMSTDMDKTDRLVHLIGESKQLGIEVLPPDINHSEVEFSIEGKGQDVPNIRYGLGALKGLGHKIAATIVAQRKQNGPYKSLSDLCHRISSRDLNRRAIEVLICSGALDCTGEKRHILLATLDRVLKAAEQFANGRAQGLQDMFGQAAQQDFSESEVAVAKRIYPLSPAERAQHEYRALGVYLREHPVKAYRDIFDSSQCSNLAELSGGQCQCVVMVEDIRHLRNMDVVTVSDSSDRMQMVLKRSLFREYEQQLQLNGVIRVVGLCEQNDDRGTQLKPYSISSLTAELAARDLRLNLCADGSAADFDQLIDELHSLLSEADTDQRSASVTLNFEYDGASVKLVPENLKVSLNDRLLFRLHNLLGPKCVSTEAGNARRAA